MNYQNTYYPFHQNIRILKGFFAKPLTLICGIVAGLSAILGTVKFNSGSGSTNISVSAGAGSSLSILLCIALIFLYVKSRSNDPMPFGGMVTLIKIYAIIGIIATGIAILALAGLAISVRLFLGDAYFMLFAIIISPFILITLLHSIAMLMWSNSIKKGATSVYLSSRGSILLAVTSILLAVVGIATTIAMAMYIKLYGYEFSELLRQLADEYPSFHYNNAFDGNTAIGSIFLSAATIIMVINSVLSAVFYGLFAALAISYHMYIKKYTMGINLGAAQAYEPTTEQSNIPVPPVAPVTNEMPTNNSQPAQQPIDFQPKSVDFGSMETHSDNIPKAAQFENPYTQAVADDTSETPDAVICPNCHTKCGSGMKFCGNCGTRLR
ncbi:zinc ribbon domain-containing protein [Ruminococcus bromii]|uniref:zinc ribbon domain-containing protein n=1 Tax=Ruminococcus bromii TaxID=40518 RepID=UPI00266ECB45|nr:zinc ribbon domain-containing protein [Ruminococcus bromii]